MRVKASVSSLVLTVRSENGTPRPVSNARPDAQGAQLAELYSVTGKRLTTWRSSKGRAVPLMSSTRPLRSVAVTLAAVFALTGALSEKVTLPSAPTMR